LIFIWYLNAGKRCFNDSLIYISRIYLISKNYAALMLLHTRRHSRRFNKIEHIEHMWCAKSWQMS